MSSSGRQPCADKGPAALLAPTSVTTGAERWRMRSRVMELRTQYRQAAAELLKAEQAAARVGLTKLGPHQAAVLAALAEDWDAHDWRAFNFNGLSRRTALTRAQVQRACKALRRLGFAKLEIGLWDEDGYPWGAGYRATAEGVNWYLSS